MGVTKELAEFAANLSFEKLPKEVIERTKVSLMDTIGVIVSGSATGFGKEIIDTILSFGGKKESTIIGTDVKTSCRCAALANGSLAELVELDDGHRSSGTHQSSIVPSTSLAIGESMEATGKDAITSMILGYEIMGRVGKAIHPSHMFRGFIPAGTCGTLGSAVAAGKILNLDEGAMADALGIASYLAPITLAENYLGPTIKPFHAGHAAQVGILAASLAERGYTGSKTCLEGGIYEGFCKALSDEVKLDLITEKLGEQYEIMDIYFKPYAACRYTHAAIESVLELRKDHNIDYNAVGSIVVKTHRGSIEHVNRYTEPTSTFIECQFSIPYTVAVALIDGQVSPSQFSKERIRDQKVHAFAKKVTCILDPEIDGLYPDKTGSEVEIIMKDGRIFGKRSDTPKGDPRNPLTVDELKTKFRDLTAVVMTEERIKDAMDKILGLEKIDNIALVMKLLH